MVDRCTLTRVTVLEVIQRSAEFLARKGVESPRLQVELLLASVLKIPRLRLYLDFERGLTDAELELTRELVKRRGSREPLQHILGTACFCGLDLVVNEKVLIPRPETEVLAERAWEWLQARNKGRDEPVTALDFGTGSGCLALALARHVPTAIIDALDISADALQVARDNASRLGLAAHLRFFEGPGFQALPADASYDLIVANPPYIATAEIEQLAPEVREHDPHLALDGGPDGLDLFRMLASDASGFLRPGGRLMAEFGDDQGPAVAELFRKQNWVVDPLINDLTGRARIVIAHRMES